MHGVGNRTDDGRRGGGATEEASRGDLEDGRMGGGGATWTRRCGCGDRHVGGPRATPLTSGPLVWRKSTWQRASSNVSTLLLTANSLEATSTAALQASADPPWHRQVPANTLVGPVPVTRHAKGPLAGDGRLGGNPTGGPTKDCTPPCGRQPRDRRAGRAAAPVRRGWRRASAAPAPPVETPGGPPPPFRSNGTTQREP